VLDSPYVAVKVKERLKAEYKQLNPAELKRKITRWQNKLMEWNAKLCFVIHIFYIAKFNLQAKRKFPIFAWQKIIIKNPLNCRVYVYYFIKQNIA
jgi:hypothetical protein